MNASLDARAFLQNSRFHEAGEVFNAFGEEVPELLVRNQLALVKVSDGVLSSLNHSLEGDAYKSLKENVERLV